MNSTGKASNLSTLVSIIHHTWMRPSHFSNWSLKKSPLMNALNYTETHQRRLESKTENSRSSTQKSSKSKYKVTWYEKGSWKIQVKKSRSPKKGQRLNTKSSKRQEFHAIPKALKAISSIVNRSSQTIKPRFLSTWFHNFLFDTTKIKLFWPKNLKLPYFTLSLSFLLYSTLSEG